MYCSPYLRNVLPTGGSARFASGLSVAETAAALGKKEPNVKVLQHKGVKSLRALFTTSTESQQTSGR